MVLRLRMLLPAVALAFLLAGCFDPAARGGDAPVHRPAGWDQGDALVAYEGFRAHSADEEVSLIPEDAGTVRPAFCGAYQDGVRKASDRCTVGEADGRWGPWTIVATWDGRGEGLVETEQDPSRRTVVAYDAEGKPIAWWAGAFHPDGGMAIE